MRCPLSLFGKKERIIEFYYNELSEKDRMFMEKHLKECNECVKYYNEVKKLILITKEREMERINYSEYIMELRGRIDNVKTTIQEYNRKFSVSKLAITVMWVMLLFLGVYNYKLYEKEDHNIQFSITERETEQFYEIVTGKASETIELVDLDIISNEEEFLDEIIFPELLDV